MKKTALILTLVLMFGIFAPALPAEADAGPYIVKLADTSENTVRLMENLDIDEIYPREGLYRADSLADVRRLGSAVEYYEKDAVATLFALTDDHYSADQWSLEFVSVNSAWDKGYDGQGIRVAVIDSGANSMHEDFEGADFERGSNMLDGSHDVTDLSGHGTFVSGLLAATANNLIGIAGLCDRITIVPIKCFGEGIETSASYIINAVYEAIDIYDCDVINLSLGMEEDLASMRQAMDYAEENGVIVVSAVGNDGNQVLNYPAAYNNVVGVGSVDAEGKVASFSQKNSSVYVTAPGAKLVGLGYESEDSYVSGGGTSYSTPFAAAAAVFLKELNPKAGVKDFMAVLRSSVKDAGAAGYDTSYGYGVLDLDAFVREMTAYVFPDIDGHWAEDNMAFCAGWGYFNGYTPTSMAPDMTMSRAMFATVVSRVSGEPISGYENPFTDVPDDSYYAQACAWGAAKGIVQGVGNGRYDPDGNVTREQMAVFLYRFADSLGIAGKAPDLSVLSAYTDNGSISGYARQGMAWAVESGLMSGKGSGVLDPQATALRSEVAALINRFADSLSF